MAMYTRLLSIIAATALLLPFLTEMASAQVPDVMWQQCKEFAPTVSVAGCTQLINDGTQSTLSLADAYRYRGIAHLRAGDFNLAREDEEQAARLNPEDITP